MPPEKIVEVMETVRVLARAGDVGQISVQVHASLFYDILLAMESLLDRSRA